MNAIVERKDSPVALDESSQMVAMIERMVANPDVDVAKLEKLLAIRERMIDKQAEQQFHQALSEAQSQMKRVRADATNPQTHSKYASYAALDRALRPIYTEHGFALSFSTEPASPETVMVICRVSHRGGHAEQYKVLMPADGKGPKGNDVMSKTHATGSALSYGMRYLLKMIFNVAVEEDDDDGNSASVKDYPKITQDQALNIQALIDETKTEAIKFCAYFKIGSVTELHEADYKSAVKMLEHKRRGA